MQIRIVSSAFAVIASIQTAQAYNRLYGHSLQHNNHDHHHHPHSLHELEIEHMEHDHDYHAGSYDDETFFRLHDLDNDGYLNEKDLQMMYHGHDGPQSKEDEEDAHELIEAIFHEVDHNHDRQLSLHEFLSGLDIDLDEDIHSHIIHSHIHSQQVQDHAHVRKAEGVHSYKVEPEVHHLHRVDYGTGIQGGADILHHPDAIHLSSQNIFSVPDKFQVVRH